MGLFGRPPVSSGVCSSFGWSLHPSFCFLFVVQGSRLLRMLVWSGTAGCLVETWLALGCFSPAPRSRLGRISGRKWCVAGFDFFVYVCAMARACGSFYKPSLVEGSSSSRFVFRRLRGGVLLIFLSPPFFSFFPSLFWLITCFIYIIFLASGKVFLHQENKRRFPIVLDLFKYLAIFTFLFVFHNSSFSAISMPVIYSRLVNNMGTSVPHKNRQSFVILEDDTSSIIANEGLDPPKYQLA